MSEKMQSMKRTDYKAVKHMDKEALTQYLARVWQRGYDVGYKAGTKAGISQKGAK